MAYNKYDSDKQGASFMDGIPVKISEKYKPPKKITLPGAILNKLNTDNVLLEYDFTLERSVMDKMSQWRQLRKEQREARRERIEAEKQTRTMADVSAERNISPPEPTVTSPQMKPYPILTPVPINASNLSQSSNYSRSFNISDFEQDTSSPFDNMELKTINDLEELAHVLQPTVISDKNEFDTDHKKFLPPRLNGYNAQYTFSNFNTNWNNSYGQALSGSAYPGWHQTPRPPSSQSYVVQRMDLGGQNSKSVPDIVQQLEMDLKGKREADSRRPPDQPQRPASIGPTELSRKSISQNHCSSESPESPTSSLPNPYRQLSSSSQQRVDRLAEMGFPLPRVARAAELFENDETRIVEFLVEIQRLEEMNFPADRAEKALIANNYKHLDTVEYLKTVNQLLDLGFKEDKVEQALAECGSDRDKALDLLIS